MTKTSLSINDVDRFLKATGLDFKVRELPLSTRTAMEAAAALGCEVGQIAKSIVFRGEQSDRAILVIASGTNRINEETISQLIGEKIVKADADFVKEKTGYVIGGVPPVAHVSEIETFVDEDLLKLKEIWAAGGGPNAVFSLSPNELVEITQGKVVAVK